jgi:hypothetical protein
VPIGNSGPYNVGLQSRGPASGVNVVIPPNPTGPTTGVQLDGGSFRRGSVTGPTQEFPGYYAPALGAGTSAPSLIEDATLQAFQAVSAAGAATIRRVNAISRTGFQLQSENPAGGKFVLEDSLWRTPPGSVDGVGLQAGCGSNVDLHLTARNLTLANGATGSGFNYAVASVCNLVGRSAGPGCRADSAGRVLCQLGQRIRLGQVDLADRADRADVLTPSNATTQVNVQGGTGDDVIRGRARRASTCPATRVMTCSWAARGRTSSAVRAATT